VEPSFWSIESSEQEREQFLEYRIFGTRKRTISAALDGTQPSIELAFWQLP